LSAKYEHSRGNSTDSTSGASRGLSSTVGRYYEGRRNGPDSARPQESYTRQWSGESTTPYPKEHSKGILNLFKKRPKASDSSHPSPEEQYLESPTSPIHMRQNHLPYTKPSFSTSDVSVGERPSSNSMSDHERLAVRSKSSQRERSGLL
jgi:mitogen-activated protein kinase kinase kinase